MVLKRLTDERLTEAYNRALDNGLSQDFIDVLKKELERRDLRFLSNDL